MSKTRTLKRVVVTGMAGISPLVNDWPAVRAALERNESGIVRMKDWDEVDDLNTRVAAPAKPFALDPAVFSRKRTRSMGRVALMAVKTTLDALEDAGLAPEDVDCVNGHGTATDRGDVAESLATYEVFGGRTPYTTYKGLMGHTLGACGALEAIFSIRGMIDGIVSPVLNLENPDAACAPLNFVTGVF